MNKCGNCNKEVYCKGMCKYCYHKQYRLSHKNKFREYSMKYYRRNPDKYDVVSERFKKQWVEFFKQYYGDDPKCQLCGRQLDWCKINGDAKICWDHRHGFNGVHKPSHLIKGRKCTKDRQREWLSYDFGLLCNRCNCRLPTENRDVWIENLIKYNEKRIRSDK